MKFFVGSNPAGQSRRQDRLQACRKADGVMLGSWCWRRRVDFKWERWHSNHTVIHLRAEEVGGGGFYGFGLRVLFEFYVVEHEAEIFFSV